MRKSAAGFRVCVRTCCEWFRFGSGLRRRAIRVRAAAVRSYLALTSACCSRCGAFRACSDPARLAVRAGGWLVRSGERRSRRRRGGGFLRPPGPACRASFPAGALWRFRASGRERFARPGHLHRRRVHVFRRRPSLREPPRALLGRRPPAMANWNVSGSKPRQTSLLIRVNAGTLRSACQRAVTARESSASSEMIRMEG